MKNIFQKLLVLCAASMLLWACEKEETRAVLKDGATPQLTASATTLDLKQEDASKPAISFNWGAVDYGFTDAIAYVLQIAKAGTNFASASTTEIGVTKANLKKEFTVAELNAELNKILTPGQAQDVEVRLKANTTNSIMSNTVKVNVKTYRVRIFYTYPQAINLAGNFQNWSPATGPQIVSLSNNGAYEGFINFSAAATPEFKMVKGNDWSAGDFGSPSAGKLGNGGDNLKLTGGAGIYLIRADVPAMTWNATKINSWGLIGNAVPTTGWDSDRDMTFDAATGTYNITLNLNAGEIKFRANDAWEIDLGDKAPADGRPELGGSNIKIDAAGNYTITLDLLIGGNWVYTIKKN